MNDYNKELKIIENIEAQLAVLKNMLGVSDKEIKNTFDFNTYLSIDKLPAVNADDMSFVIGKDACGEDYSVSLKNNSSIGIIGQPGAGKSDARLLVLSALIKRDDVEVDIIESRGMSDYGVLKNYANTYIEGSDADKLKEVVHYLSDLEEEIDYRFENLHKLTNENNFWNVSSIGRKKADLNLIVLSITDIQDLFFETNSGVSREVMRLQKRIGVSLKNIISKGRSAGVVVLWEAQKSINGKELIELSDNTSLKVSFKTNSPYEIKRFFGVEVPNNQPSPLDIEKGQKGVAVVMEDANEFKKIKFNHIDYKTLKKELS